MATTINATYKKYNGTDWDTIYFKTSASQVGESNGTLNFLRPNTHKVNGKSFWSGSAHQGITLYGTDIKVNNSSTSITIAQAINNLGDSMVGIDGKVDDLTAADISLSITGFSEITGTGLDNVQKFAAAVDTKFKTLESSLDELDGYAKLDSNGKIELTALPDSILGQVSYTGLFDANSNMIMISDDAGANTTLTMKLPTKAEIAAGGLDDTTYYIPLIGNYFIVTIAGTFDGLVLGVGDWLIYNGTFSGWGKVDNTDAVSSVAGLTGIITAANLVNALKGTTASTLAVGNHTHKYAGSSSAGGAATTALACTGNSATATKLAAAANITIGASTKGFDGGSAISFALDDITSGSNYRKVYLGSTTPSAMRTGDIWLSY